MIGYHGPIDQWQHELRKVSKSGLVDLIERMFFLLHVDQRDSRLRTVKQARSIGRSIDACTSYDRFKADPHAAIETSIRRRAAAKRSARRRKKAQKGTR